ncbi:MAG: hypothetical protein J0I63_10050 [Thiobacillus sp.]|nr:hypothetical protein [Thiobacillus sp.]
MLGVMVRPYFLSKPFTAAITTDAQSVSGMNHQRGGGRQGGGPLDEIALARILDGSLVLSVAHVAFSKCPEGMNKKGVACEGGRLCPLPDKSRVEPKAASLRRFSSRLATPVPVVQNPCVDWVYE